MRLPPTLAFTICSLIWGTTWLAIKIGYEGLDPIWGASARFLIAGVLLVPLVLAYRLPPPMGRRQVGVVAFVGVVLFGLDYGLIYWGETRITSGLTAILFATLPLFVGLFAAGLLPHERVTRNHVLGVIVGIVGLSVIFSDELAVRSDTLWSMLAIIGSAAAAAISSVVVRRWGQDLPPLVLNNGAMLVGGVCLAGASVLLGETQALPGTRNAWFSLLYLVFLGSIVSFLLYWDLLKVWGPHRSALIVILTPVVAVITGLAYGERLSTLQWLGSAVVLAGVALSLYNPTSARRPAPATLSAAK